MCSAYFYSLHGLSEKQNNHHERPRFDSNTCERNTVFFLRAFSSTENQSDMNYLIITRWNVRHDQQHQYIYPLWLGVLTKLGHRLYYTWQHIEVSLMSQHTLLE